MYRLLKKSPGAAVAAGLGWLLSLAASASMADPSDPELLSETDLLTSIPFVTTATRLSQSRADAPAAITTLDRTMIEASGAQEIADLFRLVPGFQAYHVNGHKFAVTAHGMGSPLPGRLEVLVDGRSVYLTGFSSPDWRALGIGIHDIERIEVVRSPSVSSWGSNAFQGAVNIITRDPVGPRQSELLSSVGERQARKLQLSHRDAFAGGFVRLGAGYQEHDGFSSSDNPGDNGHSAYANLRSIVSPTLSDEIDLQLGFSGGDGAIGDSNASRLSEREFTSNFQSLTWTHHLDSGDRLQLRAYHNYLKYTMERRLISELFFPVDPATLAMLGIPDESIPANFEEGITHRYDLELEHELALDSELRLLWGAGWRRDDGKAPLLLNTERRIHEDFLRLFGNLEWRAAPRWLWNGGVMIEHSDIAGTLTSPRLALNYQLAPGHTLRGGWSLSHRTPSMLEAYQDTRLTHSNGTLMLWLKNTDGSLVAEENRTLELGYLGELAGDRLVIDLRLFREEIDHGIGRTRNDFSEFQALDPLPPAGPLRLRTTNANNADWVSYGLEAELRYRPGPGSWVALQYGYLEIDGEMDGGDLDTDPEALILDDNGPEHTVALLASRHLWQHYQLSGALYYQSATDWINGDETDDYTRLDLRLARTLRLGGSRGQLALVIQNLGGDYTEFQQRNQFETRAYLTASLSFP